MDGARPDKGRPGWGPAGWTRVVAVAVGRDGPRMHMFGALLLSSYTVPGPVPGTEDSSQQNGQKSLPPGGVPSRQKRKADEQSSDSGIVHG